MILMLERRELFERKQTFGCSIVEIVPSHVDIFRNGLNSLGETGKIQG